MTTDAVGENARAAGRRALRGERRLTSDAPSPRPRRPRRWQTASRDSRFNLGRFAPEAEPGSSYPRPAGGGGGGRRGVGPGFVWVSFGFRWGWGAVHAPDGGWRQRKTPAPAPAFDARHQCVLVRARHHTARDMSLAALCRASPASRAPPPSCPALSTLSRPLTGRRFAGVAISTISLPSPPSHCHLTAISTRSVRSLPHLLYHTRGGGGSGISCASLSSSASGSVVERRSQRSIADALDRKEIGRALRCSAQIDCPVRALK